jgi:hypothetical protein
VAYYGKSLLGGPPKPISSVRNKKPNRVSRALLLTHAKGVDDGDAVLLGGKLCRWLLRARERLRRLLKRKLERKLSAQLRAKRLLEQLEKRQRKRSFYSVKEVMACAEMGLHAVTTS